MNPRNLILITLDSLRADHCSFLGYNRETTPTLNKMAKTGLYFEEAIAASVPTGPSMYSIFTSTYPIVGSTDYNGYKWRKAISHKTTLQKILSNMRYYTVGINTNPFTSPYFGFNKGFLNYVDLSEKGRAKNIKADNYLKRLYLNIKKIIKGSDTLLNWEKYYDKIIDVFKNIKEPFFVWIILLDTHTPYLPPRKYRTFCKASSLKLLYIYWKLDKNRWYYDKKLPEVIDAYDDSIRCADTFLNRLWEDVGDKYDPIFIIHADHGDGLCEHGFYHHPPYLYEELIHVPLVIYNADVKGKIEKPVSLLSLAPTILQLIGEENVFPSKSVFDYDKDYVISQVIENGKIKVAVRTKRWKFITGQKDEDELYDLKKDPYEQENVIDEHPDLAKEMRRIAMQHLKRIKHKKVIFDVAKRLKA